uniref:RNA polymerase sigma-70 factor n=1 Tax=uncultured Draconibacterium sp. TaxID=1573823 RepID=UPI0032174725
MLTKRENKIINGIIEGNTNAFHNLFSEYFQRLFIFAQKFVDEELAKDFVQDCFFELWQNRRKLSVQTSISAFLFTIIKNKCYKHYQKEQLRLNHQSEIHLELQQEELNFFLKSEKSILEFDIKDRIQKTIKTLPPKCAAVFNESRTNGMSNKEIAEKYGLSVKSVEKHISKALKLFRQEFKDFSTILFSLFFHKN